jgi:pimeloyl-ACP methyl ester carboxylesterase
VTALVARTLDSAVGTVEVHRGGTGAPCPLVYLHSAQGEGPGLAMLEQLADSREVAAPVFPGFAGSQGLDEIDDIEDAAFHVLDVLDRLGYEQVDLVGMSLGGWMAAETAVRWPQRVRRLVLINPVGLYIEGAPITEIFGRPFDELAAELFADLDHPIAQLMVAMASQDIDPALIPFDLIRPLIQSQAATAKLAWNPYMHNPKLRARLARISAPTLIVHGVRDGIVPRAHAEAYAAAIAGARVVDLEGAAHLAALEQPEKLAALVIGHLEG